MKAKKFDSGKPQIQMIPPIAIKEEAMVMGFGAAKYDEFNWAKGMKWSRLVGAAMRHIVSWNEGESKDPESGVSHLAHARCCLGMLMAYEAHGLGEDDRYGPSLKAIEAAQDGVDADEHDEGNAGAK